MKIRVYPIAGPLAALGGLLWTLLHAWLMASPQETVSAMQRPAIALVGAAVLFMALGWLSIYRRTRPEILGTLPAMVGFVGTLLVAIGFLISAAAPDVLAASAAVFAGQLLTAVALVTFGVTTLMKRFLPRANFLPLLMALVYIPSAILNEEALSPVVITALAIGYGLGWVALGLTVWLMRRRVAVGENHTQVSDGA
jgi:hypothetical protein